MDAAWRDHPLCAADAPWPARFWGPEACDPAAWGDLVPLLDPSAEVELLVGAVRGATSIVDVGGGTGLLTRALAARVAPVLVIEPARAQLRALAAATAGLPGLAIACGRAEALPLPDRSHDAAVATWVLQYTADPARAVRELGRVARRSVVVIQAAPDNDLVAVYNAAAALLGEPPAHHGYLLALAAAELAAAGYAVDLRPAPTPLAVPPDGIARVADVATRLHHAAHPRRAELAAAGAAALAARSRRRGGALVDDGVMLVAER